MSGDHSHNNYWSTPAANYNPYTTALPSSNYPTYQYAPQQTYTYSPQPGGQAYGYPTDYDPGQSGALPVPPVHAPYPYSTYSPAPAQPAAPLPYYTSPVAYTSLPSAPTTLLAPSQPAPKATVPSTATSKPAAVLAPTNPGLSLPSTPSALPLPPSQPVSAGRTPSPSSKIDGAVAERPPERMPHREHRVTDLRKLAEVIRTESASKPAEPMKEKEELKPPPAATKTAEQKLEAHRSKESEPKHGEHRDRLVRGTDKKKNEELMPIFPDAPHTVPIIASAPSPHMTTPNAPPPRPTQRLEDVKKDERRAPPPRPQHGPPGGAAAPPTGVQSPPPPLHTQPQPHPVPQAGPVEPQPRSSKPPKGYSSSQVLPEIIKAVQLLSEAITKLRSLIDSSFATLIQPSSPLAPGHLAACTDLKRARALLETFAAYMKLDTQEVQVKLMVTALEGALTPLTALLNGAALYSLAVTSEQNAKATLTQHYLAVNFSIKSVLQAAEMLKAKKYERYLALDWQDVAKEKEQLGVSVRPLPAPAPARYMSQYERKTYDVAKVVVCQKIARSWLARRRLVKMVAELLKQHAPVRAAVKQRQRVLKEVLETEQSYVEHLQDCVRSFVVPLRMKYSQQTSWFSHNDWATLNDELKEMEAILHINMDFRDRLTKCMADGHIADVFTAAVQNFRTYSSYINGYDEALHVLGAAKKSNPALEAFLRECRGKLKTDFESHLILPVQRLPRYQLLLKEVLKLTPLDHADYVPLNEALVRIADLNGFINSQKRAKDNVTKVNEVQKRISGLPMALASAQRSYVRDGPLDAQCSGVRGRHRGGAHVFLLSDILIVCERRSADLLPFEDICYLRGAHFVEGPDSRFNVKLPEENIEWSFWAANDAERSAWTSDLSTTKDMLELNILTDANLQSAAGRGFQVLHGTYGKINNSKEAFDVTAKLRDISAAQGGRSLVLRPSAREKLFGLRRAGTLNIVYAIDGDVQSALFSDSDAVNLSVP